MNNASIMYNFLKNLFFPEKMLKQFEDKTNKTDINDSLKLSRPLFGRAEILEYDFDKEILKQEKTFQEIAIFQKVNQVILSNLDSREISSIIVDEIRKKLGYILGGLFVVDMEKGVAWPYIASNEVLSKLEFMFGKRIDQHVGEIKKQDNLVVKSIQTGKIYITDDFRDLASPVLSYKKAYLIQRAMGMKTFVIIPLKVKDKIYGVLTVVSPRDGIDSKEKILLKLLADQVGIALYNAKLYEEIQKQVISLQQKTQDLQSLLSLSQMSSSGLEIEKNIQTILDIIPEKLGHLEILGAVLVRYDENIGKVYAYITTESDLVQRVKKILSKPALADYAVFVAKDGENYRNLTLTSRSILSGEIKSGENLADFISPPVERSKAWLMQKMMGGKSFVAMPINIRGEKLGAVIFMFKKQLSQIASRDIDILKAFSQQIGVAIENLQFYQSLNKNIEELTRTKSNLEEAISMKNDFLHIVSHQLRTPLTAVRGFVYMWRDGDFDNLAGGKMAEIKARVADNIDRLNNIVNDMIIAMESQGSMKLIFAPTDIETLLKENIEMLKSSFEKKGLYIKYQKMNGAIPLIEADGKYLRHVFMNLIDNAAKYTEKGGLEIAVRREKDTVYVRFVDTGVGISDSDKVLLFKKFSRGKNSSHINPGGSGLGLFISKQILDEHHGKLQYSSLGEGKGATFVVELPVAQPVAADASSSKPITVETSLGEKTS